MFLNLKKCAKIEIRMILNLLHPVNQKLWSVKTKLIAEDLLKGRISQHWYQGTYRYKYGKTFVGNIIHSNLVESESNTEYII